MGLSTNDLNTRMAEDTAYVSVVVSLLCVTGVFGNLSVIFIYRFQIRRRLGNRKLLPTLATMDLVTCVLGTAFILLQNAQQANFANSGLCKSMYVVTYTCLLASSFMIVVITIQRFLQVCHPLYLQGTPLFINHAPWTLSALGLILASPLGIFTGRVKYHTQHYNSTGYRCNVGQNTNHKPYFIAYFSFLFLIFITITVVLTVLNSFIAKTVIRQRKEMRRYRRRNKTGRKGKGKGVCFSSVMMIEYCELETRTEQIEHIDSGSSNDTMTLCNGEHSGIEIQRFPHDTGQTGDKHVTNEEGDISEAHTSEAQMSEIQSVAGTAGSNEQEPHDDAEMSEINPPSEHNESNDYGSKSGQQDNTSYERQILAEDATTDPMCMDNESDSCSVEKQEDTNVHDAGQDSCDISEMHPGSSNDDDTVRPRLETGTSETGSDILVRRRVGHTTITTRDISKADDEDAEGTRYSIMLMVISLTFVLTWLPVLVVEITEVTDHVTIEKVSPSVFAALRLCESFVIVNHVANPYIYAMFDSEFRARLLHIVFCVNIRQFFTKTNLFVQ